MSAELQGQHLHFDCVSGIAGDMTLGALIDLGVPAQLVRDAIKAVGLGDDRLQVEAVIKSGISSIDVRVRCENSSAHDHDHSHDHAHSHDHHHYAEIRKRIEESCLDKGVIDLSIAIFDRVAEAEAKLHGTTVESVAFHEVGAIDSIVDIVGAAAALHWLSPVSVSAGTVAMGRGTIKCAHGILPVPSPAAAEILRVVAAPVSDGGIAKELCTPTGAAILATIVNQWGSMPPMIPVRIGYGAGDIELPDRPNVLRIMLGKTLAAAQESSSDTVTELEANIDDMSPELCEHVAEALFTAGALDVWWTAITMKKGRPALALRVMCASGHVEAIMSVLFRETSSIGVRSKLTERRVLQREIVQVETEFGSIPVKVARYLGKVVNAAPEFEACRRLAKEQDVPLKQVFAAASSAYLQSS